MQNLFISIASVLYKKTVDFNFLKSTVLRMAGAEGLEICAPLFPTVANLPEMSEEPSVTTKILLLAF